MSGVSIAGIMRTIKLFDSNDLETTNKLNEAESKFSKNFETVKVFFDDDEKLERFFDNNFDYFTYIFEDYIKNISSIYKTDHHNMNNAQIGNMAVLVYKNFKILCDFLSSHLSNVYVFGIISDFTVDSQRIFYQFVIDVREKIPKEDFPQLILFYLNDLIKDQRNDAENLKCQSLAFKFSKMLERSELLYYDSLQSRIFEFINSHAIDKNIYDKVLINTLNNLRNQNLREKFFNNVKTIFATVPEECYAEIRSTLCTYKKFNETLATF